MIKKYEGYKAVCDICGEEFTVSDCAFTVYDPCKLNCENKIGLIEEWEDHTFVNPPYSNPKPWVEKAILESRKGKHIILLLRVDVSTRWYKLLMKENIHIAYFNERIFKGSNFCSMLVFIEPCYFHGEQHDNEKGI